MNQPDLAEEMLVYAWDANVRHYGGDPHPRDFSQTFIYELLARYRELTLAQFSEAIDQAMQTGKFRGLRWFCQDFRPLPKATIPVAAKAQCEVCGGTGWTIVKRERGKAPEMGSCECRKINAENS